MKRTLLFLFLNFCFIMTLQAQDSVGVRKSRFSLELVVEPGLSFLIGNALEQNFISDNPLTWGGNFGVGANYIFNKKNGIGIGLQYSHQGQNFKSKFPYKDVNSFPDTFISENNISLNFLKVPIDFLMIINKKDNVEMFISFGIYFGILLNYNDYNKITSSEKGLKQECTLSNNNVIFSYYPQTYYTAVGIPYSSPSEILTYNYELNVAEFKKIDFGSQLNFGVNISVSKKISIPILFNFQLGFIDITNKNSNYVYYDSSSGYNKQQFLWGNNTNYYNLLIGIHTGLTFNI